MERRFAFLRQFRQVRDLDSQGFHEAAVAAIAANTVYGSRYALARKGFKILSGSNRISRFFDNRLCKGVLGFALQGSGQV